jgi:hypothetical protein
VVHATAITTVTSSRLTWAVSIKGPGVIFEWPAAVWRRASADGQAASPDLAWPHHTPSKFGGHVNKGKVGSSSRQMIVSFPKLLLHFAFLLFITSRSCRRRYFLFAFRRTVEFSPTHFPPSCSSVFELAAASAFPSHLLGSLSRWCSHHASSVPSQAICPP